MSNNNFLNIGLNAVENAYIKAVKDTNNQFKPLAGKQLQEGDGRLMAKCNKIDSSVRKKEHEIRTQQAKNKQVSNL